MKATLLIGDVVISRHYAGSDNRIGIIVDQNNSNGMYHVYIVLWEDGQTDNYVRGWSISPLTEADKRK